MTATTTKQTPEEVATLLGKVRTDCGSVITAMWACRPGERVIASYHGTAKYQGPIVQARLRKQWPTYTRTVCVMYGRKLGEDLFAVIGPE